MKNEKIKLNEIGEIGKEYFEMYGDKLFEIDSERFYKTCIHKIYDDHLQMGSCYGEKFYFNEIALIERENIYFNDDRVITILCLIEK